MHVPLGQGYLALLCLLLQLVQVPQDLVASLIVRVVLGVGVNNVHPHVSVNLLLERRQSLGTFVGNFEHQFVA